MDVLGIKVGPENVEGLEEAPEEAVTEAEGAGERDDGTLDP